MRSAFEAALARASLSEVEVEYCTIKKEPLYTPDEHPAVLALTAALAACHCHDRPEAAAFGTDAGVASALGGIPGVVFGPGDIAQAHTAREFVPIAQLETAVTVLETLFETPG